MIYYNIWVNLRVSFIIWNPQAHEDAEMLRSLVVQLEEELIALKEKVRNSDEQLAALNNAQESLVKGNDALALFLQGKDVQEVLTQLDDKVNKITSIFNFKLKHIQ